MNGRHAPVIGVIARPALLEHSPGITHVGNLVHVEESPPDTSTAIYVVRLVRAKHLITGSAHPAAVWLHSTHDATIAKCDDSPFPDSLGNSLYS